MTASVLLPPHSHQPVSYPEGLEVRLFPTLSGAPMTRDGLDMSCGVALLRSLSLHTLHLSTCPRVTFVSADAQEGHRTSLGVKGAWPCLLPPSLGF